MSLSNVVESRLLARLLGPGRIGPDWDSLAVSAAQLLSEAQVWRLFELAAGDLSIALCLHRVCRSQCDELTIPARELDSFVERAHRIDHTGRGPWLTLAFDDGYDDACYYIETRAPRYRDVEWLLFVCPEKSEKQAGFRWDLEHGDDGTVYDLDRENQRADLRSVVRFRDCHLATVDACRRIRLIENVQLGNHTNCHFKPSALSFEQIAEELRRSRADFARLFGNEEHFAFPFGTPEEDFDTRHVALLRGEGESVIWTTARRPYLPEHRFPGAVLPRFPVNCRWSATQVAFWIAMLCIRSRARGLTPLYPPATVGPDEDSGVHARVPTSEPRPRAATARG